MPYNFLMNEKNFMNDKHPITPPDELVEQWYVTADNASEDVIVGVANRASRWGQEQRGAATEAELQQSRDEELEACCLLLDSGEHADTYGCHNGTSLRAARRPKTPSLKEVALEDLRSIELLHKEHKMVACTFNIRRVLETLPND